MHTSVYEFPAALIAVGTLDVLRPEAVAMHKRRLAAGVRTELLARDGVGHGFMGGGDTQHAHARTRTLSAMAAILEQLASLQ